MQQTFSYQVVFILAMNKWNFYISTKDLFQNIQIYSLNIFNLLQMVIKFKL